jgi:RNA polymerase sigma factor (sigma-70 family)
VETRERIVDELLVLAAQARHVAAFERLASRWHPRLLRHARRLTDDADGARDAVQEAWLAIARGLGRLQDPACFGSWALRITSRRCADWVAHRQRARERFTEIEAAADAPAPTNDRGDDLSRLREALRSLGPEQRALMAMYYVEDLSVREIAEVLGIPVGTVKSRLYHARERLRAVLEV